MAAAAGPAHHRPGLRRALLLRHGLGTTLAGLVAVGGCTCDEQLVGLEGLLEVEPTAVDFGQVPVGGEKAQTLTLRNVGSFRLDLERFETGAPFFGPTGTASIGVGRTIEVQVQFRPTEIGPVSGTFLVQTDDEDAPPLEVPLVGEGIEAAVLVEPLLVDFGEVLWVANTLVATREVTITNPGTDSFDLTAVELVDDAGGAFTLDPRDVVRTFGPGDTGTIEVGYLPVAMGAAQGNLRISTSAPTAPEVVVTLQGTAVGPVMEVCAGTTTELCTAAGQDPAIDFGPTPLGMMGTGRIRIQNVGDRDLVVQGQLLGAPGDIVFAPSFESLGQLTLAPGGEQVVDVTYAPQDFMIDAVNVALGANAAQRTSQVVPVRGEVPQASINVVPRSLNFRAQGAVGMSQAPVKIINCGTLALTLSQTVSINQTAGPAPNAFRLVNPPAAGTVVDPGMPCDQTAPGPQFMVVFEPAADGSYRAEIPIASDDPREPVVTVEILATKS